MYPIRIITKYVTLIIKLIQMQTSVMNWASVSSVSDTTSISNLRDAIGITMFAIDTMKVYIPSVSAGTILVNTGWIRTFIICAITVPNPM